MVALVVHSEALQRRYVAPLCSVACLLNLLLLAGAGVLPLYIAWGSGPFWLHDATRYEQPAVTFSSSLVVQLQGLRGPAAGVRLPFTAAWTTSQFANALVGSDALRAMVVRASSRDDNLDGVADEILLSAQLPLQADEVVTAATVVAYFGVQLQVICASSVSVPSFVLAYLLTRPLPTCSSPRAVTASNAFPDGRLPSRQCRFRRGSLSTRPLRRPCAAAAAKPANDLGRHLLAVPGPGLCEP